MYLILKIIKYYYIYKICRKFELFNPLPHAYLKPQYLKKRYEFFQPPMMLIFGHHAYKVPKSISQSVFFSLLLKHIIDFADRYGYSKELHSGSFLMLYCAPG